MKFKIVLLAIFFSVCNHAVFSQPGLVACYPLDNNADDKSGNNYNGTAYNVTPTTDRFGYTNSAYYFDGNGSSIDIPYTGFLLNEYSYSAWCRLSILPPDPGLFNIISIGGTVLDQQVGITHNSSVGAYGFGGGSWGTNNQSYHCWQGALPQTNTWYHVVYTRNDSIMNLYLNDTLIATASCGNIHAGYASNLTGRIGSRISSTFQNFIGDIDDVRIFNRVLTLSEIQNMDPKCTMEEGIQMVENKTDFNIYPDPANEELNIKMSKNTVGGKISIHDVTGRIVFSDNSNGDLKTIHFKLNNGIYFISVWDGIVNTTRKFIVN